VWQGISLSTSILPFLVCSRQGEEEIHYSNRNPQPMELDQQLFDELGEAETTRWTESVEREILPRKLFPPKEKIHAPRESCCESEGEVKVL